MTVNWNGAAIGVLMPGDMGHAVGRALIDHGHRVVTCLAGRGEHTRTLAATAGMESLEDLEDVVRSADLILSILPPAAALAQAERVASAMTACGKFPGYVDCNAVAPETAVAVCGIIQTAGAPFIDAGIIGLAPRKISAAEGYGTGPRFYVSGPETAAMEALDGKGLVVRRIGERAGQASALKMTYAGLTKGTWTLQTAVLMAARRLGVQDALLAEFEESQPQALALMRRMVPFLPADSGRWIGEMEEISATFAAAGIPADFHNGAAEIFRRLVQTPLAAETRQTMDRSRSLDEALGVFDAAFDPPRVGNQGRRDGDDR